MKVIKPNSTDQAFPYNSTAIFLAGSIEMRSAENWQLKMENIFEKDEVVLFNPRRDNWDSGWFQEEKNDHFNHQVNWELNHLEKANVIFMYFSPETQSPISLLELGRYAGRKQMVVCCPDGFWRKGNVEILCTREDVILFNDLEAATGALKTLINKYERTY